MLPSGNTKGSHSIASTHTPTGLALIGMIFGRHGGAGDRILRCQEAALMDTAAYAINREQTPGLRNSRKDQQQTHRWRRRRTAAALATEERSSKAAAAQQQPRKQSSSRAAAAAQAKQQPRSSSRAAAANAPSQQHLSNNGRRGKAKQLQAQKDLAEHIFQGLARATFKTSQRSFDGS